MDLPRFFVLRDADIKQRAMHAIAHAPEGCEVVIREARRSSSINAALHATLSDIAKRRKWCGQRQDVETWKRLFTAAWLRASGQPVTMLQALDGNGVDIVFRRTSTMTQREVSELLSYIEAWDSAHEAA